MRDVFLVFGGHSPIAVACSIALSKKGQVLHATRKSSANLRRQFQGLDIEVVEADLSLEGPKLSKLLQQISTQRINVVGAAFLQRYKPTDAVVSFDQHMRVEVWSTVEILRRISESRQSDDWFTAIVATSPAAGMLVADQKLDYHIVKASQEATVRFLSRELAPKRIELISARLGSIVLKERARNYWDARTREKEALGQLGLGIGLPDSEIVGEQIANLITSSPLGLYGQTLRLDGGLGLSDGPYSAKQAVEHVLTVRPE